MLSPWTAFPGAFSKSDPTTIWQRKPLVLDGVDFTGRALQVEGTVAALTHVRFGASGGKLLTSGLDAKPSDVTVIVGEFDATGMNRGVAAVVSCAAGSRLGLTRTRHVGAPRLHLDSSGSVCLLESTFGSFGMAAQIGDHLEMIFIRGGDFRAVGCVFDGTDGASAVVPMTMTGLLMFKPQTGPIVARLDGCTLRGAMALGMAYPIQAAGTDKGNCTLTVTGCAIERGASGYIGPTEYGGGKLRVVDGGGNTDLATGLAINLAFPA